METRDLVNINREITGETIKVGESIPKGRYIQVVFVCIQNTKKEFLVQKRTKEKNGKYAFTSGHVLTKESSIEAVLREIKEEMGLSVNKEDIKLIKTKISEQDFVDIYYMKRDIELKEMKLQKEELDFVKWMKKEEIEELYKQGEFLDKHIISMKQCMQCIENEKER